MGSNTRTATLTGIDPADLEGTERRWNAWVQGLNDAGLRPADEPIRWTEDSMTYRVFNLADEEFPVTLDFDITKLATLAGIVAVAVGAAIGFANQHTAGFDLVAAMVTC